MRHVSVNLIPRSLSRNLAKKLAMPVCTFAFVLCASIAQAASCTATGFSRDSLNLTAALINPPGKVSGDVDATGCNIGIYYSAGASGQVDGANVHGANYFGIVNNGAKVNIQNSTISDIGERPFNGTQHGVAVYFAFGSAATGDIKSNFIWNYQKGGIVVNGPMASSKIQQNYVIGLGPVNFIAQNGIQAGYGANAQIQQNFVTGNSYSGPNLAASGGIIVVGGDCYGGNATTNTSIQLNVALGNDVGVWFSNLDSACNPLGTETNDTARNNTLVNNQINNTTGNGPTQGYQAAISDQGDMDVIQNNDICGPGYKPPGSATAALFAIDTTATNNPQVRNNNICVDSSGAVSAMTVAPAAGAAHMQPAQPVK